MAFSGRGERGVELIPAGGDRSDDVDKPGAEAEGRLRCGRFGKVFLIKGECSEAARGDAGDCVDMVPL